MRSTIGFTKFALFSLISLTIFLSSVSAENTDPDLTLQEVFDGPLPPSLGTPTIRIEIEESELTAKVEPGEDGVVTFHGVVYCEMPPGTPPGQFCVVTLQADAGGWPVSVPPSLTFDRTKSEESFSLSVQVPVETSTKTQGQLSVSGRWRMSPGTLGGTVDPVTCIILIGQYGQPMISPSKENNTVKIGEWLEIEIELMNAGNGYDTIMLAVDETPEGVEAYFVNEEFRIAEKQSEMVILRVRQTNGNARMNTISVKATSSQPGKKAISTTPVHFESNTSFKSFVMNPIFIILSLLLLAILIVLIVVMVRKPELRNRLRAIVSRSNRIDG